MDFLCIPIIFGCPTKIKPDSSADQSPRMCPRCNNASVHQCKARTWFELFWVPLIPMNSNRIWLCGICHWEVKVQQPSGWEPARPGAHGPPGWQQQQQQWHPGMSPQNSGYQPQYHQVQK